MSVDARLAGFLSTAAARGFRWGLHDCMLFAADWARELTRLDPASAWRGWYHDEAGAAALLAAAGGTEAAMAQGLRWGGWRQVPPAEVSAGAIVLALPHRHEPLAGIVTPSHAVGGKVAFVTRRGLVVWPAPLLAAWTHDVLSGVLSGGEGGMGHG